MNSTPNVSNTTPPIGSTHEYGCSDFAATTTVSTVQMPANINHACNTTLAVRENLKSPINMQPAAVDSMVPENCGRKILFPKRCARLTATVELFTSPDNE